VILYGNLVPFDRRVLFGYRHGSLKDSILPTHTNLYVVETHTQLRGGMAYWENYDLEDKNITTHFHEL
jgi:hypothetical protein